MKNKSRIYFSKLIPMGRLECDATDVYNWLLLKAPRLAGRFKKKMDKCSKKLDKQIKTTKKEEVSIDTAEWKLTPPQDKEADGWLMKLGKRLRSVK